MAARHTCTLTTEISSNSALGRSIRNFYRRMNALVSHLVILGRFLGKYPLERWIIWRLWSWALSNGIDWLSISHLAWAPTCRKPTFHKLMSSAENQELVSLYAHALFRLDPNTVVLLKQVGHACLYGTLSESKLTFPLFLTSSVRCYLFSCLKNYTMSFDF